MTATTAATSGEAAKAQPTVEPLAEGSGEHGDLLGSLSNSSSVHRELDQPEDLAEMPAMPQGSVTEGVGPKLQSRG